MEHYSKYILLVPLTDKYATQTPLVFQQHILGQYGACAEVVTDQDSECKGELAALLVNTLIDHGQTSATH